VELSLLAAVLSLLSGAVVGFSLGLVGGGGSILAVPLLVYLVGVSDPHIAIGTSAAAVALSAAGNLFNHARSGHVRWPCALVFAGAGVAGAAIGSTIGKSIDGHRLLALFSILMMVVGALMLRRRKLEGDADVRLDRQNLPKLLGVGLGAGIVAGFFGIGGGFLIVPGLILATRMPMIDAVGSSLVGVAAFGLTTAANYTFSGLVDWPIAFVFVVGGLLGGLGGARLAVVLSRQRGMLTVVFAAIIFAVALYMLFRSFAA
jgi:uncharacterized protein